mmetsp:Transcript_5670/g.17895  ORF Transcript_5670/g.17895 Transcript_5670/m.17895 type:complete len:146 (+) Transcript_5670:180-617(+)
MIRTGQNRRADHVFERRDDIDELQIGSPLTLRRQVFEETEKKLPRHDDARAVFDETHGNFETVYDLAFYIIFHFIFHWTSRAMRAELGRLQQGILRLHSLLPSRAASRGPRLDPGWPLYAEPSSASRRAQFGARRALLHTLEAWR